MVGTSRPPILTSCVCLRYGSLSERTRLRMPEAGCLSGEALMCRMLSLAHGVTRGGEHAAQSGCVTGRRSLAEDAQFCFGTERERECDRTETTRQADNQNLQKATIKNHWASPSACCGTGRRVKKRPTTIPTAPMPVAV